MESRQTIRAFSTKETEQNKTISKMKTLTDEADKYMQECEEPSSLVSRTREPSDFRRLNKPNFPCSSLK
jgi:hypothetical protein